MYLNVLFQVSFARPDHAEPALLLQPAEGVVVRNPGGDAHPTGLGTGTPLCGLDQAVGSNHRWVWAQRVFQSVSWESRAHKHKVRCQHNTLPPSLGKVSTKSLGENCNTDLVRGRFNSPARAGPTMVWSLGSSHTHSSQHFPGSLTLRGKGQSGLGRRTSMLHRGTQPTAPSRQVHWYLQLLWKDSPLRYTVPPKMQGAPSLAEEVDGKKRGCGGQASVSGT